MMLVLLIPPLLFWMMMMELQCLPQAVLLRLRTPVSK
jgi:hypothetical protein